MEEIHFYRANEEPYGVFSNLYRTEIEVRGIRYRSVEDAYQSLKPRKSDVRKWLMSAPSPRLLAITAHALPPSDLTSGWDRLKYPWMMECLLAKYQQHAECRSILLSTGDARLVEAGSEDNEVNRRWGEVNGVGQNILGRMLMRVRAELGGPEYADAELDLLLRDGMPRLERWYARVASER